MAEPHSDETLLDDLSKRLDSKMMDRVNNAFAEAALAASYNATKLDRAIVLLNNVDRTLVDWAKDDQQEAIRILKRLKERT